MKSTITFLISSLLSLTSFGQTFDPDFQCQNTASGYLYDAISYPNHKILVAGEFHGYHDVPQNGIVMLNSDGSLDESFSAYFPDNAGAVYSVDYQYDGKIMVAGIFGVYPNPTISILRLHPNGSVDPGFNAGTGPNNPGSIRFCKVQTDGKVMVVGDFHQFNQTNANGLVRLNADGSLDTTFHSPVVNYYSIRRVLPLSNQKYLIYGQFDTLNGVPQPGLARLNYDGTLDTTFIVGTGASQHPTGGDSYILDVAEQPDGKLIIAGNVLYYNGVPVKNVFRLHSDGTLDYEMEKPTWMNGVPIQLNLQPDGKTIIVGTFDYYNTTHAPGIIRINTNGSIDQTFNCGDGFPNENAFKSFFLDNDKIIVVGSFSQFDNHLADGIVRLNVDPILGLNEDKEESFATYPNPTNDQVTISFEGNNALLTIYDAQGKLIRSSALQSGGTISLKDVQTGVYFFELTTDKGSVVKRVVKN